MPKHKKMLNDWNAPYIQSLVKLIETQSKETLALWAAEYAQNVMLLPGTQRMLPLPKLPQGPSGRALPRSIPQGTASACRCTVLWLWPTTPWGRMRPGRNWKSVRPRSAGGCSRL